MIYNYIYNKYIYLVPAKRVNKKLETMVKEVSRWCLEWFQKQLYFEKLCKPWCL